MLLPAIRAASERPAGAYLFVDAQPPQNGKSRLDLFSKEGAEQFRASATDGFLPTWTEDDLAQAIHDASIRRSFVQELRPLPLAVYEEPIPVFADWPDAPCGFLQFTPTYEQPAEEARRKGWAYRKLDEDHFLMLNDPVAVTRAIIELADQLL